jgi:hypothetical protein
VAYIGDEKHKILVRIPEVKISLGSPKHKQDYIRMDLKEIERDSVD